MHREIGFNYRLTNIQAAIGLGQLNRIDFGVAWNAKTEHGGLTVGEVIDLKVKLEFVKQK